MWIVRDLVSLKSSNVNVSKKKITRHWYLQGEDPQYFPLYFSLKFTWVRRNDFRVFVLKNEVLVATF